MHTPENALEHTLLKLASHPEIRLQLCREFLAAELFLVDRGSIGFEGGVAQAGGQLKVATVSRDGQSYVGVFSSLKQLRMAVPNGSHIKLKGQQLLELTRGADLILNCSSAAHILTRDEVNSMLEGTMFQERKQLDNKETHMTAAPTEHPYSLTDALAKAFNAIPEVKAAYLLQRVIPERDNKVHIMIGIEASGSWEHILAQARKAAQATPVSDPLIEFTLVTSYQDSLFRFRQPFFTKQGA